MSPRKWMLAVLAIATLGVPVFAHHGTATYDTSKTVTFKAVVTKFTFINPHAEIYFDVKGDNGKVEHWIGEETTPNMLARRGWSKDVLKAGDQVTVTGNRAKDGVTAMRVQKIVFADGHLLDPNGTDY